MTCMRPPLHARAPSKWMPPNSYRVNEGNTPHKCFCYERRAVRAAALLVCHRCALQRLRH